jgi:F0F1-type ATP synthase membrane subunit b/b'
MSAAADSAVAGWSILESFLKIDPQVLSAMEFSTVQDLHGLADFHTYVQDHFFSAPMETAEGWFNRLTGYVAEQKAASFFELTGHQVVMAPVANQPVWDMLVDGHAVQIKEHLRAIKDFALAHPDIPVFTNMADAATIDMPSVHGLDVLDKDSIHGALSGTVDGLDGTFDPGFSFPVITLAFSTFRETRLLFNEHTTIDRALLNVGMDVAGVGVGALLGAKTGAIAGSVFPGPGTVIGGVLGTLAGGIVGKVVSTNIRKMPFKAAREEYNKTVEWARSSIDDEMKTSRQRIRDLQEGYQAQFQEIRNLIEARAKGQIEAVSVGYDGTLMEFCLEFPMFLEDLRHQLRTEERNVVSSMPYSGFFGRIFPTEVDLRRHAVKVWFRRTRKTVGRELRTYQKLKPRTLKVLFPEVRSFLQKFSFELTSLQERMDDLSTALENQKRGVEAIRQHAVSDIEEQREKLIRDFGVQVTFLHESIVAKVKQMNEHVSAARDSLRRQAAAVGINL